MISYRNIRDAMIPAVLAAVLLAGGYRDAVSPAGQKSRVKEVIFATTTSVQDTGLLDAILPVFRKKTGYFVKAIAVGSGQAMALGERGEADVILAHSPEAEKRFMDRGFGSRRRLVMHNYFLIVGPGADPAKAKSAKSAAAAFRKIASSGSLFISRADNSGTHARELKLWKEAGISPESNRWYQQTGLGMGQTLRVASEKGAYTITDAATFLSLRKSLALAPVLEGGAGLKNEYYVIELNAKKHPAINAEGGRAFAEFLLSPECQRMMGEFGVKKFGKPLFVPDAVPAR